MKPYGTYKIRYQRARGDASTDAACEADAAGRLESLLDEIGAADQRVERVVDSLHQQILEGGGASALRIRRVFSQPREIFRVELERPDLGYQRTLLLGRDALDALLAREDIQPALETLALAG